jgi:Protein of unknown function (DUF4012)
MVTTPEGTKPTPERVYAPKPSRRVRRSPYFRNPYARKRRGPSVREILVFLFILAILLIADGVYVGLKIQEPLSRTSSLLQTGADELLDGNVEEARAAFQEAVRSSMEAEALSTRPSLFIASHIPWFNREADALRALAVSARLISTAGTKGADAIEVLGGTSRTDIADAIYANGQLQFDTISDAQVALASASTDLTEARDILEHAPFPRIKRLADALDTARDQVVEIEPRAVGAAQLLDVVPRMMGRDGPRRYFVALQNPAEARATGGLIGLYGIMEADGGRIRLTHVGPGFELATEPDRPISSGILMPGWYAERYGEEVDFAGVNRSPNFPLVARAILQMYRNATGTTLDGVWSFDPMAFEKITVATGPLSGPGYDVALGPDNATDVLLKDAYDHFGVEWQGQVNFLTGVIQDLYDKLGSSEADTNALFEAMAKAAQASNLKIYSRTQDEEDTLVDLGLSGAIVTDGLPTQMAFHNNLEGNKVDYFLQRTIRTSINLLEDGGAQVTTDVTLDNQSPSGPPSVQLGYPQRGERVGFNQMELNLLLPKGATEVTAQIDGQAATVDIGAEGQSALATLEVGIPPQRSSIVTFSYTVAEVQRFGANERSFGFVLIPQPLPNSDLYEVELVAPDGYRLSRTPLARRQTEQLTFSGTLDVPTTLRATLVKR